MDTTPTDEGSSQYVRPETVNQTGRGAPPIPPQKIVLQQPGGLFGRFGKFLWIALVVSVIANIGQRISYESYFAAGDRIEEKYFSGSRVASDKVAIIRVEGAIMDPDGFVKRQIERVSKDKHVRAVVLRVDSPGGTVTASDSLYHRLREMLDEREIPMVVSMGGICASGGYYVSMAVGDEKESIYAEPSTWTGSIGVVIPHYDVSGLLEKWHIQDDSIASHRFKQLGSPTRKLSKEERAEERKILQGLVDDSFARFKEVVRAGRPAFRNNEKTLKDVATGQVFSSNQALEHGLIDRIGFLEAAIDRAIELAKLDKETIRVVKYTRHMPGLIEALSGSEARAGFVSGIDLGRLVDMTAPRAYYLCTWLPSVLSNTRP
ncbi:MAG: signal peptide peptidase SppA [Pirellulales bacterium]